MILPVKVASKSLYETSTVSLFCSSSDTDTSGSAVTNTVTFPHLLCVFPTVFEQNRDRSQSTLQGDLSQGAATVYITGVDQG